MAATKGKNFPQNLLQAIEGGISTIAGRAHSGMEQSSITTVYLSGPCYPLYRSPLYLVHPTLLARSSVHPIRVPCVAYSYQPYLTFPRNPDFHMFGVPDVSFVFVG